MMAVISPWVQLPIVLNALFVFPLSAASAFVNEAGYKPS